MSRQPRYALKPNKFLSDRELEGLRAVLDRGLARSDRDSVMIMLALETGARATELLNLTVSDLDHDERAVFIHGLKGSNDRKLPLRTELFEAVAILAEGRTDRIFEISYPRLQQIWNEFKPGKKSFHSLRHTFAIELFKRERDLRLVQLSLGHRAISNTMIYADYQYSLEELKRIIRPEATRGKQSA